MEESMTSGPATVSTTLPTTLMESAWSPILDGALRERALAAVQAIADSLQPPLPASPLNPSLSGGQAGLALFYAYLAQVRSGGDEETARRFLGSAIDAHLTSPMRPTFYGGFTGVAWTVEHLHAQLFDSDDEDP